MIATLDDFEETKRRVEAIGRRLSEVKGELKQVRKRLASEYELGSTEEARTFLDKLAKRERSLALKYTEALTEFKTQYAHILEKV